MRQLTHISTLLTILTPLPVLGQKDKYEKTRKTINEMLPDICEQKKHQKYNGITKIPCITQQTDLKRKITKKHETWAVTSKTEREKSYGIND